MSHIETSKADSAQSKDVRNENLEFLMSSAVCLLSADCLLSHLETSNTDSAQSKDVWNELWLSQQTPNEPLRDF